MPSRSALQPSLQVWEHLLAHLTEEGQGQVPGGPAGPAQLGRGLPQRGNGLLELGQRRIWGHHGDEQPHVAIAIRCPPPAGYPPGSATTASTSIRNSGRT